MVQLLIEVDDAMAKRLEDVAPARSRKRSEFVRDAIRRALWDLEEAATREAYLANPDDDAIPFDPSAWETPVAAGVHESKAPYGARKTRKR